MKDIIKNSTPKAAKKIYVKIIDTPGFVDLTFSINQQQVIGNYPVLITLSLFYKGICSSCSSRNDTKKMRKLSCKFCVKEDTNIKPEDLPIPYLFLMIPFELLIEL